MNNEQRTRLEAVTKYGPLGLLSPDDGQFLLSLARSQDAQIKRLREALEKTEHTMHTLHGLHANDVTTDQLQGLDDMACWDVTSKASFRIDLTKEIELARKALSESEGGVE